MRGNGFDTLCSDLTVENKLEPSPGEINLPPWAKLIKFPKPENLGMRLELGTRWYAQNLSLAGLRVCVCVRGCHFLACTCLAGFYTSKLVAVTMLHLLSPLQALFPGATPRLRGVAALHEHS